MKSLVRSYNPLDAPGVTYCVTFLRLRLERARAADSSRGASAIEWAIITAVAAVIAIMAGGVIYTKVKTAANNTQTVFNPPP